MNHFNLKGILMKSNDLLLVIDMQNAYLAEGEWACLDTPGAAQRISSIIEKNVCKEVIFTEFLADPQSTGVWRDYNQVNQKVNDDPWSNEMIDDLKPWLSQYPLYSKSVYSSLAIPEVLAAAKCADRVVITGVVAECCVLSTVMELIDAGIYVIYLTDGVSGLTKEKEKATELILSGLSPLHLSLMTTAEYLESMSEV